MNINREILAACESFSAGRIGPALPYFAEDIRWTVIGKEVISGVAAVKKFCAEMSAAGCPRLQNKHVTIGDETVVIEGSESQSNGLAYCDCYAINQDKIQEMRSYCICSTSNRQPAAID